MPPHTNTTSMPYAAAPFTSCSSESPTATVSLFEALVSSASVSYTTKLGLPIK